MIRDYSHGETLGNGVKWQYFPARGAGELRYLYTSSGSAWSSLEGASLPPSLRQASHFRGAHLLWPAGLPQVGGEAGREEPQIEVDAGSCKVGTLKVREIHMTLAAMSPYHRRVVLFLSPSEFISLRPLQHGDILKAPSEILSPLLKTFSKPIH